MTRKVAGHTLLCAVKSICPTADLESHLLGQFDFVVGMDEVGRGAIAGPLAVGAVLIDSSCGVAPSGLADSKILSASVREALVDPIRCWAISNAVGWAAPSEISSLGVTAALRLAGLRALKILACSVDVQSCCVLLDGKHDWLSCDRDGVLFSSCREKGLDSLNFEVFTRVKADLTCQVVAAASIVAKVDRDCYMSAICDPGYHWHSNKGYASSAHVERIRLLGPCRHHRLGWKLPGVVPTGQ